MKSNSTVTATTTAPMKPGSIAATKVTSSDVADTDALARLLTEMLTSLVAATNQTRGESYIDFADVAIPAASGTVSLQHNFGRRAKWSVVRWSGAAAFNLSENSTSTTALLVLTSTSAGTATVRVF